MALVGVPGIARRGVGRRSKLGSTLTHVKLGDGQPWKKSEEDGEGGKVVKLSIYVGDGCLNVWRNESDDVAVAYHSKV